MVHGIRIRIRDGKAEWYRNRWVGSPQAAKALGDPSADHFGIAPIGANTNVIGHAGRTPCADRSRPRELRTHRRVGHRWRM
jgi:carotenoid cleavage dioxygenase